MARKFRDSKVQSLVKAIERVQKNLQAENIDTGDIVSTPKGVGVVAAEMGSSFRFPTGPKPEDADSSDANTKKIEVEDDEVAFVVGFVGESGVYFEDDIEKRDYDTPEKLRNNSDDSTDGDDAVATVDTVDFEETDMPNEGWDQFSLMSFYSEMGGSVDEMANALQDEQGFDEKDAIRMAASLKDQILGTERWRNRF